MGYPELHVHMCLMLCTRLYYLLYMYTCFSCYLLGCTIFCTCIHILVQACTMYCVSCNSRHLLSSVHVKIIHSLQFVFQTPVYKVQENKFHVNGPCIYTEFTLRRRDLVNYKVIP